jgi:hypothetical protein
MRLHLLIIILLVAYFSPVSGTSCNRYPKILGANLGDTYIYHIDIYAALDRMALGGGTSDSSLTGSASYLPYVVVRSIANPDVTWAKAISGKAGADIYGVIFSTDGALLIAHSYSSTGFIVVFNGATGAVVSSRKYS